MASEKTCGRPSCGRRHKAKGLCSKHYKRLLSGTLDTPRYSKPRPPVGVPLEWPFEFEKIGGVWHRRPTGSDESWVEVVYA